MKNIGYKLKIGIDDNIYDELTKYFNIFNVAEINITDDLLNDKHFSSLINFINCQHCYVSYHLHSDLLLMNNYKQIMYLLNTAIFLPNTNFIIHLPEDIELKNYYDKILNISNLLPANTTLLLENTNKITKAIDSICRLDEITKELSLISNDSKIGICLDIGHLLLNIHKDKENTKNLLSTISKNKLLKKKIKEYHIHSYSKGKGDHQPFNHNDITLIRTIQIIKLININIPIIIEIKNFGLDIIEQAKLINRRLYHKIE